MPDNTEILQAIQELSNQFSDLKKEMNLNFKGVYKRLDGIEFELKKLNTVTKYQEQYNNIPT